MAEWLREPGFAGTHATMGADISQFMAMLFTALFLVGGVQAKKGNGTGHHWLMLGGMVAMLAFFTSYYLFRQLGVLAFEGKEGFGGSQTLYENVFVPLLTFHILLVVIGLVMAIYMIVLGCCRANHLEENRDDVWNRDGCRIVVLSWPRGHRRIFRRQARRLPWPYRACRHCVWCGDDHSEALAEWRAAPSGVGPVYHRGVLHPVCHWKCDVCHAVYFVSWKNWIDGNDVCLRLGFPMPCH